MPPRFTFAAGNARVLLRAPLYAAGAVAARLVPRSDRLWVAGSGIGLGEGALPLVRAARARLGSTTRVVWLASTTAELAEARAAGLDAELKRGWRGFRLTLRARVAIVTHGFGDVNRFGTSGAFVVQLWHGIPVKRLHLDSPAALRVSVLPDHALVRRALSWAYRRAGRGIRLFPVASELVADRIASAFGIPRDRIVVTGDPRDDALVAPREPAPRDAARPGPRRILYAPTWRDGAADPAAPDAAGWERIAAWLAAHDAVLDVRAHPLGVGDYAGGPAASDRIRMLGADVVRDVNAVLADVDVLITDYSSIALDFAQLRRPIVFLAADLDRYAGSRGLYDSYRDVSGGRAAADWDGALDLLTKALAGDPEALRHAAWLDREYVDVDPGGATERVLDAILARVTGGREGPTPTRPRPRVEVLAAADTAPADTGVAAASGAAALRLRISPPVASARLDGRRGGVDAHLTPDGDGVVAVFDLLVERWGVAGLALPSDDYRLLVDTGDGPTARVTPDLPAAGPGSPVEIQHPRFRARAIAARGGFKLRVEAPLADDERGRRNQSRLERAYRRSRPRPRDAVVFESFYGQSASCNPLGIDRALAAQFPGVTRYWSVVDGSVAVPAGAEPLIEGSRAWWEARASARVLVVNDWLRKRFRRRRHQRVLQTWHGTMLKRLALDRANVGLRTRIAVLRERNRWDALLAQNPYSAAIFRSAYAMRRPIWELGYPRGDVLAADRAAARVAEVRAAVGIPAGARVVLYAPTWRDDRREMVEFVDAAALARDLGPDHVLLVRGHSRTLRHGSDLAGPGVVDVTSYPDVADLLLVADVLVTDYSSVMFDFAATLRPIVFFTPDLARYSSELRGFYVDLLADAPGAVIHDAADLAGAVRATRDGDPGFAQRRIAWRDRFTPRDDGLAGARVVERMIAEGWLPDTRAANR